MSKVEQIPISQNRILPRLNAFREKERIALFRTLTPIRELIVATGKQAKAEELARLIYALTNQRIDYHSEDQINGLRQPEPTHPSALAVARLKRLLKRNEIVDSADEISLEAGLASLDKAAFVAFDVNAFLDIDGQWQQQHKFDRLDRPLTDEDFLRIMEELIDYYCYSPQKEGGRIRVCWDLGLSIANGRTYDQEIFVEVIAKPLDPELLQMYLLSAYDNGLFLASNLHFAALEALIESNQVETISVYPAGLESEGITIKDMRREVGNRLPVPIETLRGNDNQVKLEEIDRSSLWGQLLIAIISNIVPDDQIWD